MRYASFWDTLQQPIIALAPMDGVTDAPNRTMHGLYGRPDVVLTEFTICLLFMDTPKETQSGKVWSGLSH